MFLNRFTAYHLLINLSQPTYFYLMIFLNNNKHIGTLYSVFGAWSGIFVTPLRILIKTELGQPGSLIKGDQIYDHYDMVTDLVKP
jgi:rRNA processing protein Gar1